jgi:hypothetical protein
VWWNVHGLAKYKIDDPSFITLINYDIIMLAETWTDESSAVDMMATPVIHFTARKRKAPSVIPEVL